MHMLQSPRCIQIPLQYALIFQDASIIAVNRWVPVKKLLQLPEEQYFVASQFKAIFPSGGGGGGGELAGQLCTDA